MNPFPNSPRLLKDSLVVLDTTSWQAQRTTSQQNNPDQLQRSLGVCEVGADCAAERSQPFRRKGSAAETVGLEADIDATDQLAFPDRNPNAAAFGIAPQLAALEALVCASPDVKGSGR